MFKDVGFGMALKPLPKAHLLRWEITAALAIKVLLLLGLWFLIFRFMDRPATKPDIAVHFALPVGGLPAAPDHSSQSVQESRHVR
jgi:hypothetical protein